MEYVWYVIAALGAGIGTGLAGLSAATVMVPILIVLCPSFSGETVAYQAALIYLNYRDFILSSVLIQDTIATFRIYLVYILSFAATLIILQLLFHIPQDIFRKLLHIAAFTSSIFVVLMGRGWMAATITLAIFAAIVYPALKIAESWSGFSHLFVEKKPGEICNSLLLLFISQAVLVAFTCGFCQKPYILVASTAAWGLGDIAAAWVGRPLGKHKINLWFADHKKSWEGSVAMAATAFAACLISIVLLSPYSTIQTILISLIVAITSSLSEMASKGGIDTVTVPCANVLVLWLISLL